MLVPGASLVIDSMLSRRHVVPVSRSEGSAALQPVAQVAATAARVTAVSATRMPKIYPRGQGHRAMAAAIR